MEGAEELCQLGIAEDKPTKIENNNTLGVQSNYARPDETAFESNMQTVPRASHKKIDKWNGGFSECKHHIILMEQTNIRMSVKRFPLTTIKKKLKKVMFKMFYFIDHTINNQLNV